MKYRGYKLTNKKAKSIGVWSLYMNNRFRGGGWHWQDIFHSVRYLYLPKNWGKWK